MSWEIVYVLAVVAAAVALMATERMPVDQVAVGVPVALLLGGVLTVEEAVAGFSHPATLTVGAMLVLSLGLQATGGVAALARWVRRAPLGGPGTRLLSVCLLVAAVSPFLNNTAVVVVFLPVFLSLASRAGEPPSRYLLPLSYSAILGGTVTLVGTSTNLIVWGVARERGYDELSLFSIAPLGLVYLGVGLAYLFTVGRRLLPARHGPLDLSTKYDVRRFVTELEVGPASPLVGRSLEELDWGRQYDLSVLDIHRGDVSIPAPGAERRIRAGDVLVVQGDAPHLLGLASRLKLVTPSERLDQGPDPGRDDGRLVEVVVAPGSPLAGRTLKEVGFHRRYGAVVLAIQHHGRALHGRLAGRALEVGDLLLLHGPPARLAELAEAPGLVPLGEVGRPPAPRPRAYVAAGILAAVVTAAGLGLADILAAALVGAVVMVFTGCVTLREVYRQLDWGVLALLAGLIPLGLAMDGSGAAAWLGATVAALLGGASPFVVVAVVYLATSLLTEVMSNNAAAVVLAPIALTVAAGAGMNPYALLVAVMFGASASFMTPLGYQTNALVYEPGGYRFSDFLRVGGPLNLILLLTASVAIPLIWPA